MRIAKEVFDEIKDRVNVADLAEELGVRRKHGGWLCPFHDDTHPSMSVRRRGFRCFACGAKGDALSLVMRLRGLAFREALDYLARRSGVWLPSPRSRPSSRRPSAVTQPAAGPVTRAPEFGAITPERRRDVYTALARGVRLHEGLPAAHPAFAYLRRRGISPGTAIACGLGTVTHYASTGRFLLDKAPVAELQACGLFNRKGNFRLFAHRLLLPYWLGGEAYALQARNVGWRSKELDGPKELTLGPVTIPFNAHVLLDPQQQVFVCEGAIDTLSLVELGLAAVGIPGVRNFRPDWVALFADVEEVVLALDNDDAGQRGAEAITGLFAAAGRAVKVLRLPEGVKDCNEFLTAAQVKGDGNDEGW